jgi:CBS domain containing-hemolysin-like protein
LSPILVWLLSGLLLVIGFSSALTAFSLRNFSRSRVDELCRNSGKANRFSMILKRHNDAQLSAELLLTLMIVGLGALSFRWFDQWRQVASTPADWLSISLLVLLLVSVLLFVAVVIPWALARVAGEIFIFRAWPAVSVLVALSRPLLIVARKFDRLVHRLGGVQEPADGDVSVITEERRTVVDEGQREGVLESEARTMIHRVMELQDEDVAAIMTPRTEMDCIPADSSLDEARLSLLESGHSRVPVIGKTTDDIIGILYAKDLLKHLESTNGQKAELVQIIREPLYVPETSGIDTLLQTMKSEHVHLAIVVDEYSGVAGLVTLEDILEEIVGEIVDEYDPQFDDGIESVEPGVTEVLARVHIDDLNEQFQYDLPEDGDFDTIGGFVLTQLGRIPKVPESLVWRHLRITILEADSRKLYKLRIETDDAQAARAADEA